MGSEGARRWEVRVRGDGKVRVRGGKVRVRGDGK